MFFILSGINAYITCSSKFATIGHHTKEFAVLGRLKNLDLQLEKCRNHSSAFFLVGSSPFLHVKSLRSSFLQVTRISIKAWVSLNFGQILHRTA